MQTPLYLAVSKLKYECAMKLLDAGANVHHADDARRTPLHAAMQHGEGGDALLALLNRLLQLGAAVGAVDREQRTPLHWASGKDALPLVTALITAKADVNAMDWAQHAPLHWACPMDAHECAGALLAAKAIPSAQDRDQRTPLHWAADKAALKCLTLLLGQTGISVRAPRAHLRAPRRRAPSRRRPPRRRPAAPRPSLPQPPLSPLPGGRRRLGRLLGAALRGAPQLARVHRGSPRQGRRPPPRRALGRAADRHGRRGRREEALQDDAPGLKRRRSLSSGNSIMLEGVLPTLAEKFYAAAAAAKSAAQVKELLTPAAFADATTSKPSRRRWATRCR